ncbi:CheR family methyltransferase [Pseudomonas zhanjiangensis]|uniref:CheR family methyltransferase n=1 Tax=Pseudomonas zhanjiangensis TaxID=3239015 RepID=A0ABV3YXG4_9PSED
MMARVEADCSPRLLAALSHKVLQHLGMDFTGPRSADLLRRLQQLAFDQQVADVPRWLQELAFSDWDASRVQQLVPAFTVGETYFRRDLEAFDWLRVAHLQPLLARRRAAGRHHLRLWSAGCCTGEEAYGLLFLLDELLGEEREQWSLELVASDINTGFLARAEQAVYGRNAFRSSDEGFRNRYFQAEGRQWRVRPAWRGRIRFLPYNLADARLAPALADADLILCRNVLMYFSPARALAALRRLLASLSGEGLLLLSAVEAGLATQAGLNGHWAGSNYALRAGARQAVGEGPPALPAGFAPALPTLPAVGQPAGSCPPPLAPLPSPPAAIRPAAESAQVHRLQAPREGQAERDWQLAGQAQAAGRPVQAREALLSYLREPGLSQLQQHQAYLALARLCADQRELVQAGDWLQRALALDSSAPAAYWLQALLAQQQDEVTAALLAVQKALYLDPAFILGHFLRARLLRALGRAEASDKALRVCRELLEAEDAQAPLPLGDGLSCGQLLRLCQQLQEGGCPCPSP